MRCDHCKKPLTARKPKVVEMKGIVRDRKGGGIHQIRQAEPTGKVWCQECGDTLWYTGKLPSLVPEGQMTIV